MTEPTKYIEKKIDRNKLNVYNGRLINFDKHHSNKIK